MVLSQKEMCLWNGHLRAFDIHRGQGNHRSQGDTTHGLRSAHYCSSSPREWQLDST